MNITIELCIFELVWVPNFVLNWQFWFFGVNSKFAKKPYFRFQTVKKKMKITIESYNFELDFARNSAENNNSEFFAKKLYYIISNNRASLHLWWKENLENIKKSQILWKCRYQIQLKWQYWFFDQIYLKRVIRQEKEKNWTSSLNSAYSN